jgi:hypothetical protein
MTHATTRPLTTDRPAANNTASSAHCAALELRQLQRDLIRAVSASSDKESLLVAIGNVIAESTSPVMVQYFHRNGEQQLVPAWQLLAGGTGQKQEANTQALLSISVHASNKGVLQVNQFESQGALLGIAVPVFSRNQPPEALAIAVPHTTRLVERIFVILQLAASHVTMWNMLQDFNQAEGESQATAALLEILAQVSACDSLSLAAYTLAGALKNDFQCQQVAIGLRPKGARRCVLLALSEHAKFDRNSSFVRSLEAALDEAMLRGTLAVWPDTGEGKSHATRAQQKVGVENGAQTVITAALENEAGAPIGAWLFLGEHEFGKQPDQVNRIRASAMPVGSCLQMVQRAERGTLSRWAGKLAESRKSWRAPVVLAAAGALAAILCLPLHYQIKCDCQMQPFTHRFIAAPFDGRLEKAFVGPGDVIRQDTVLARMEGRDSRLELAGVEADHGQAMKRRDAALAGHDMVTAQLARLEADRLALQTQILQRRSHHLEIKSPIDGVVLSGDQERAEGAPLTIGQSLFEVAPLDKMVVELAVAESEITHIRQNMAVAIELDAFPRKQIDGAIVKINPRSETKEERNVFIAEVHIDNVDGTLRPGMNGRAKIRGDRHPLGWNLFHKPWQFLASALGF